MLASEGVRRKPTNCSCCVTSISELASQVRAHVPPCRSLFLKYASVGLDLWGRFFDGAVEGSTEPRARFMTVPGDPDTKTDVKKTIYKNLVLSYLYSNSHG